jgi:ATP-dependent DNA helicase RecG
MELTTDAIAKALRLGEDSANEFKSLRGGLPHADDLATAIVAFANSGGGWLWLGVEDDGIVSGAGDRAACDALLVRLDEACQNNVVPPIMCSHQKAEYDHQIIVVTNVPSYGSGRPYRTRRGIYYIRGGASKRIAPPEEVKRLVMSAAASAQVADELPVGGTSVSDIDTAYFSTYYQAAYEETPPVRADDFRGLLTNLRILSGDELSLMGLLCFGRNPQQRLPWARIIAAREPGTDVGLDLVDRKDFGGPLERQIVATEDFLVRHLESPVAIRGFASEKPENAPLLPLEAVREAIRNAIAHRDYAATAQINVTVYDDRLEVVSPGRLLNSVTVEAMKLGAVHIERNPLIATVLAKRHLMTERGTGVRRMVILMRQYGLPGPDIEERGPSLIVTLRTRR